MSKQRSTVELNDLWNDIELKRCEKWITQNNFKTVCLQFPNELLSLSSTIEDNLNSKIKGLKTAILGDTSYSSCCVDELAAGHINANAIIHFGHACHYLSSRIPVLYIYLKTKLDIENLVVHFKSERIDASSKILLFYDVSVHHLIGKIHQKLLLNYKNLELAQLAVDGLKPNLLCWSLLKKSYKDYCYIYVGKNNLTFFNMYMGLQSEKWFLFDIDKFNIEKAQTFDLNWMQRRIYLIEKCRHASSVGIIVGTLASNELLPVVTHIQSLLKRNNIKPYLISVGKINPAKLANFPEIDIFISLSCPENTVYISKEFYKPLITIFELEMAFNPHWQKSLPNTYSVDLKEFVDGGKFIENNNNDEIKQNSKYEAKNKVGNDNFTLVTKSANLVAQQNAVITRFSRNWNGLEIKIGADAPAHLKEGRHGLAIKYDEAINKF